MNHDDAPDGDDGQTLTGRTFSGLRWTYLQMVVSSVLQLVVAGVLARLLDPEAFGLVALATLTLRFVNYLARGGVTGAIVQKPELRDEDVRAGFTASLVLGLVFFGVVLVGAPLAADLVRTPELVPVLRWMGLQLLLHGLGATADGLLRRRLDFRTVALRSIVSYVVGYAGVALVMAAMGFGLWSLVAGSLAQTGIWALLSYVASPHPVLPTLSREAHRAILSFGLRVSLISFLEFLGTELDTLAVGRYLGAGPVGLYNRAYILVKLPLQQATMSLSSVLFPAFSTMQTEVDRVQRGYLGALRLTSALVVPVAAGMAVAGRDLVLTVLGPDWTEAIVVVPWLAASAALNVITHLAAIVSEAKARLNPKIAISLLKLATLAAMLTVAAGRDLVWFAAALTVADLVAHVAYAGLVTRVLELPLSRVLAAYLPSLAAAATVGLAIAAVAQPAEAAGAPPVVRLAVAVLTGAVVVLLNLRWGALRAARNEAVDRLGYAGIGEHTRGGRALRAVLGVSSSRGTRSGRR